MKMLTNTLSVLVVLTAVAHCEAAEKTAAEQIVEVIAPLLDEQVVLVAHVDYTELDADASVKSIGSLLGKRAATAEAMAKPKTFAIQALKKAGAKEAYFLLSLADVPVEVGALIVPVPNEAKPQVISSALEKIQGAPKFQVEQIGNCMVSAGPKTLARIENASPFPRAHLAEALAAVDDAPLKIVLTPPDYFRPVIEQTIPELPKMVGGGPSTIVTEGVQWAAIGVELLPQPSLRVVVQSESNAAAEVLRSAVVKASELGQQNEKIRQSIPEIKQVLTLLTPTVEGDQVVLELGGKDGGLSELFRLVLPK
jgi:hypothetical protein